MKHFLSVQDVDHIEDLIEIAIGYKSAPKAGVNLGSGKRIGIIFFNPSLRTRISTQIAAKNLGLDTLVFDIDRDGWKIELEDGAIMNGQTVEHIKDAAPVLGSFFDIICIRSFPQMQDKEKDYAEQLLQSFKAYAGIPIVSLESATLHPLQSLADLITIREEMQERSAHFENRKPKIVMSWAPHIKPIPQCVANSFAQWVNAWGEADFKIVQPKGFELSEKYTRGAQVQYDQEAALRDADFIYVKNWSSYNEYGAISIEHNDWMLTEEKLTRADHAKIMHCLPVRRNLELSDQLLDNSRSLVQQQAANRVWAAQAVLSEILKNEM